MNPKNIPVYIINHNRLDVGFRSLVEWLWNAGHGKIVVIDNGSTYEPLLEYYRERDYKHPSNKPPRLSVIYQENKGPWTFWEDGYYKNSWYPKEDGYYIVTDPDVCPSAECPNNLVEKMVEVFEKTNANKVGPSLRIDNLPDTFFNKKFVQDVEGVYGRAGAEFFPAMIDTTFALYKGEAGITWDKHYRLGAPYKLEHRPWYENSNDLTPEERYYRDHANKVFATMERMRVPPEPVPEHDKSVHAVMMRHVYYHIPRGHNYAIVWDDGVQRAADELGMNFATTKQMALQWIKKREAKRRATTP
jgi:hypothetical protein